MKNWRIWSTLLVLICIILLCTGAGAETKSGRCGTNLIWELTDSGVLTIQGDGDIYEYSINENFITTAPWGNAVKQVIVKEGVTSIGDYAFAFCKNMDIISIPESVKCIGDGAFLGCSSLTRITIPNNVISIGNAAFRVCNSLKSITIPEGVSSIESYTFYGCNNLMSITIPASVISIGDHAFEFCNSLRTIILPDNLTYIGTQAFGFCTGLLKITIPAGVTEIKWGTFIGCHELASVSLPDSLIRIEDAEADADCANGAFGDCLALKSITLPEQLEYIGAYTFLGSGLSSINIPVNVTYIGTYAFCHCPLLTEFSVMPNDLSIGNEVFFGSTNVTIYCSKNSATHTYAVEHGIPYVLVEHVPKPNPVVFMLPANLTAIENEAFANLPNVDIIMIPSGVTSIAEDAFAGSEITLSVVSGSYAETWVKGTDIPYVVR